MNQNTKCEICNRILQTIGGLSSHISRTHKITIKNYYDKFIRKKNEGICPTCGKETTFQYLSNGYSIHCSCKCNMNDPKIKEKFKQLSLNKYGTEYAFQAAEVKEKIKNSMLKNHGVENCMHSPKLLSQKNNKFKKKYGVENPSQLKSVQKKKEETTLKNFGFRHMSQCPEIYRKQIDTMIKKYGVTNCSQLNWVKRKKQQTWKQNFGVNHYSETSRFKRIARKTRIKYIEIQKLNGEPLVPCIGKLERQCLNILEPLIPFKIIRQFPVIGFFPDGYIPELNLVIEFDEEYHFSNNQLSDHDIERQEEIEEELNCRFFRIKQKEWIQNQSQIIEQFKMESTKNV